MALTPGTKIGPYEVLSSLGAGGPLSLANSTSELQRDRAVALTRMRWSWANRSDPIASSRSWAKAEWARSTAPATRALDGEDLRSKLADAALPPRKTIDYAMQIASGLAAAHEKGVVHRDLKPENVFVTREWVDRSGKTIRATGASGGFSPPSLSPDVIL